MARTLTIIEHDNGRCHVFESHSRGGASLGDADSLAAALARTPGLDGESRLALLYEVIRSTRRVCFTPMQIATVVARANVDADAEDARFETRDGEDKDA